MVYYVIITDKYSIALAVEYVNMRYLTSLNYLDLTFSVTTTIVFLIINTFKVANSDYTRR
jgi:hypothetical protein